MAISLRSNRCIPRHVKQHTRYLQGLGRAKWISATCWFQRAWESSFPGTKALFSSGNADVEFRYSLCVQRESPSGQDRRHWYLSSKNSVTTRRTGEKVWGERNGYPRRVGAKELLGSRFLAPRRCFLGER
eukprot:GEMP01087210.1.p1 GENE.GEMP01087210.1~~GEMP01087210.1.p1  ORF type:complete len:130 (+),score=16.87 GEMP01087210.1:241-630(+)